MMMINYDDQLWTILSVAGNEALKNVEGIRHYNMLMFNI